MRRHSLPVTALSDPAVTEAVLHRLTLTLDDRPAAGETWRGRRRGLNTALKYAVGLGELADNPLERIRVKRVAAINEVDPRVVVTHAQARELLTAVSYVGSWDRARGRRLVAFFATLYYGGLRPAEATATPSCPTVAARGTAERKLRCECDYTLRVTKYGLVLGYPITGLDTINYYGDYTTPRSYDRLCECRLAIPRDVRHSGHLEQMVAVP
jgi:hypothetical protein